MIKFIFILISSFIIVNCSAKIDNNALYKNYKNNTAIVSIYGSPIGTAFISKRNTIKKEEIVILTAKHVIENEKESKAVKLVLNNKTFKIDNIVIPDDKQDIALIHSKEINIFLQHNSNNIPFLSQLSNQEYDRIVVSHIPSYKDVEFPIVSEGVIQKIYPNGLILLTIDTITYGSSGSPVFSTKDNLTTGMLLQMKVYGKNKSYSGLSYAISSSKIIAVLNKYYSRLNDKINSKKSKRKN